MKLFQATATIAVVSNMVTCVTAVYWQCLDVKFSWGVVVDAANSAWSFRLNSVSNYPKACFWGDSSGDDQEFRSFPINSNTMPWTSGPVYYYVVSNSDRSRIKVFADLNGGFECNLIQ
ncbi:CSEP0140 putative effector protein [Blumeria hordei DH14]|uniref:CSEP0140 putative effector protein n=1 Tax=Blumeria graminis f. sp. hordei (strain DH14) TaxID=546991 RepID=N1JII6_BLUG1|nr:CSEP0140 putative effector protein [Blumeria hordei DH14]